MSDDPAPSLRARCPSCAAPLEETSTRCEQCGHVLTAATPVSDPFAPFWRNGRLLVGLGGFLLMLATLLPWATIATGTRARTLLGYQSDGLTAGILGGVLLLIALFQRGEARQRYSLVAALLGAVAGIVIALALLRLREIAGLLAAGSGSASIGPGMYLSFFGALLATYGGYQRGAER